MNPSSAQTFIGIDYGLKRIGIAVGNSLTRHAQPLEIIANLEEASVIKRIKHLIREWQASEIVLGLPRHPDGAAHEMTQLCLDFQKVLINETKLTVHLVDERYSSAVLPNSFRANARGQTRSTAQDDLAAAVILQQYLDER